MISTMKYSSLPHFTFHLKPLPPFRLDLTAWLLRRAANNKLDQWDGVFYQRAVIWDKIPLNITERQISDEDNPDLEITITESILTPSSQNMANDAV